MGGGPWEEGGHKVSNMAWTSDISFEWSLALWYTSICFLEKNVLFASTFLRRTVGLQIVCFLCAIWHFLRCTVVGLQITRGARWERWTAVVQGLLRPGAWRYLFPLSLFRHSWVRCAVCKHLESYLNLSRCFWGRFLLVSRLMWNWTWYLADLGEVSQLVVFCWNDFLRNPRVIPRVSDSKLEERCTSPLRFALLLFVRYSAYFEVAREPNRPYWEIVRLCGPSWKTPSKSATDNLFSRMIVYF